MPARPARKPLHIYHHGDLRDALVQAALAEAERGGPEAINISALAKKLGVSQPAPYKHFALQAFRRPGDRLAQNCRASPTPRWISACAATGFTV